MDAYLNKFMDAEAVYYLNKVGRNTVGAEKIVTKNAQCQHTLMRNDIYIHFHCPEWWCSEYQIQTPDVSLIADAVFFSQNRYYFLEVDNQQKMTANKDKLFRYNTFKCSGLWQKNNNGSFPILLFYTLSEYRKSQLRELNPGLDLAIMTKKDLL